MERPLSASRVRTVFAGSMQFETAIVVIWMRLRTAIFLSLAFTAAAQAPAAPPPLNPADVLSHIKATIAWYRHVNSAEQIPALAGDILLRDNTHTSALKAVQLAFDFGKAAVSLNAEAKPSASGSQPGASGQNTNLAQAAARAAARVESLQTALANLDKTIAAPPRGTSRETLDAQRDTLQSELNLAQQVRDTINTIAAFSPASGGGTLAAQIADLERTVPELPGPTPTGAAAKKETPQENATAAAPAPPPRPESAGIVGLATELFSLSRNRTQLQDVIDSTGQLQAELDRVRAPLLDEVRALIRHSEDLGTIAPGETVEQLSTDRRDIETLGARFKQLSLVTIPLGEQRIVVAAVRGNLSQALETATGQYSETGRYLLLRLGFLAAAIVFVFLVSSAWRRITFRYVRDARRRTQFLMLRRILVACAISIIVVLSFVSEFGSLATYAGLLTAGIAVALQNVILSVVAYFFLIGRYGIRTGDRVTISGVTGTVIDIGLVRIYLAELAGSGGEWHPTGRVVVYSNSVLFQPAALFKQMPETDYVWHTVRLVLTPASNFLTAEKCIAETVDAVYQKYREGIERQHANFERAVDATMAQPRPEVRLHYSESGLEALVYYPAQIKQAALTDNEIIKALEEAIAHDPELALASAGSPRLVATAA